LKKMKASVFSIWKKLAKPIIIRGKDPASSTLKEAEAKRERKRNKRLQNGPQS